MIRPDTLNWATNELHPPGADPWSGQPNKVAPLAGKIATGRLPTERPPAEETNYWRNEMAKWSKYQRFLNAATFQRLPMYGTNFISRIDLARIIRARQCYDDVTKRFLAINSEGGATIYTEAPTQLIYQRQGFGHWKNSALASPFSASAPSGYPDICTLGIGIYRYHITVYDDGTAGDYIARLVDYTTWNSITPSPTGQDWHSVDVDTYTPVIVAVSSSTGQMTWSTDTVTWTAETPGLSAFTRGIIRHSHDSDNMRWVCLADSNQIATADTDITDWTVHPPYAFAGYPCALAYDPSTGIWLAACDLGFLYASVTNGASWGLVGQIGFTTHDPTIAINHGVAVVACVSDDPYVDWRLWVCGGGEFLNADSWAPVYPPTLIGCDPPYGGVCYGGGHFSLVGGFHQDSYDQIQGAWLSGRV